MATFVVEDGTGVVDANSYCTVAEWKQYWVEVGYDFSAYADPAIEAALVRATRYVEGRFRNQFYGYRETDDQALSWPRIGVTINCLPADGTVPKPLKNAINEYAKRALPDTAELQPDPADTDDTGQRIKKVLKKVGPIEKSFEYQAGGSVLLQAYPAADQWLEDLMPWGGGTIRN